MPKRALILSAICAAALSLTLCAGCAASSDSSSSQEKSQTANPVVECATSVDLQAKSTLVLEAPASAQSVAYSYIETDGIAQVVFSDDSHTWTVREKRTNEFTDITGMEFDWQNTLVYSVGVQDITARWVNDKACIALGYRPADMTMCTVSCEDETVTSQEAVDLWESIFYTE